MIHMPLYIMNYAKQCCQNNDQFITVGFEVVFPQKEADVVTQNKNLFQGLR